MSNQALKVNGERLNLNLQSTCSRYGALANTSGMRRLALSQEDKDARDWLVAECKSLGCEVLIDQMGNIFAIRDGTSKAKKPIAMGSHQDTQPAGSFQRRTFLIHQKLINTGGRYDGILGIQAGLEVLRILHENDVQTYCPVALVDWTNEEGARFPGAMMCSGVWSTKSSMTLEDCYRVTDPDGVSMRSALEKINYLGPTPCDYRENGMECHFELHIEQGPKLETAGKRVGVVTAVQGMKWFAVKVRGVEGHSGTTPMGTRSDALVTASRFIASVRDTAIATALVVATVGVIKNDTQSQATIPSGVEFIIDVRCSTDEMVDKLCTAIFKDFDAIIKYENNQTSYEVVRTWGLPESQFDLRCIEMVRAAAHEALTVTAIPKPDDMIMDMKSGAGHDSAWTSRVVPTSMIFVPSRGGISHNPNEYTSPEDCTLGAQVLLGAVLRYDALMANGISSAS